MSAKKTLLIMRHAKSDWETGEADHERPLNAKGRRQSPSMGNNIRKLNFTPDLILSSDSVRTKETWQFAEPNLSKDIEGDLNIQFLAELYAPSIGSFQSAAANVPDSIEKLMMLSHNPGCDMVVEFLSGEPVMMSTANAALALPTLAVM